MNINEATITRIRTLSKAQRLSMYELAYRTGMPPSTVKSIMNGKSKNPGIVNIKKALALPFASFTMMISLMIWNRTNNEEPKENWLAPQKTPASFSFIKSKFPM